MARDSLALFEHPVFQIELLADDLKSLIENLAGILIRAGPDRPVDDALLFGFEVNGHGVASLNVSSLLSTPYPAAPAGLNLKLQHEALDQACIEIRFVSAKSRLEPI
jgi:hypothetical protein